MSLVSKSLALLGSLLMLVPATPAFSDHQHSIAGDAVVPHEAIVRFEPGVNAESVLAGYGYEVLNVLGENQDNTFHIQLDPMQSITAQLARLSELDAVRYAQPNYVLTLQTTPDDTDYSQLWGMKSGFGSNAEGAWAQGHTGSNQVYVAVIDSGIDVTHPDLAANMWVNEAELNGTPGVDDDGNGFVDDIHGYDFLNDDGSVNDAGEHPHGTHVAGTIGAVGNNAAGVTGVNWNVKMISAKFINAAGAGNTAFAILALDYVTKLRTKMGLDIIATNNSYGGPLYQEAFNDAIRRGGDAGILFVAAAGNDGADLEGRNDFPAVYNCHTPDRAWDCVVTVGALDQSGNLASFSNYGATRVDLAAPGSGILSTVTGGGYGVKNGTSMAAPHVAGALALCVGSNRGTSAKEARELLLQNVQALPSLTGKVASGGTLDVSSLVSDCAALSTSFSSAPSEARASAIYTDRIRLDWSDDTAGEYEHEIQIATGPAGCTGSFSHYAFIGPGIDSYPIRGLNEAEFHCLRVRALKDGAASSWATSNVAITWTTNAPFITGKVTLDDGVTPVADALVRWQPAASNSASSILYGYSATDGTYVMQVSAGTKGKLSVGSDTNWNGLRPTPTIPLGLNVGGEITVTDDTLLNLTLPPQFVSKIRLIDRDTQQPIAGAKVYTERETIYRCNSNTTYKAWSSAANPFCSFYPSGNKFRPATTDSNGELELALPTADVYSPATHKFSLVPTPNSPNVVSISLSPENGGQTVSAVTSELVTVSGKVLPSGSTTGVAGATVRWQPVATANNVFVRTATTSADGSYSIQVAKDQDIEFWYTSANGCAPGCEATTLPLGQSGLGSRTFSADTTLNLTGIPTDTVTIRVTEEGTNNPIAGATLRATREAISYCDKSNSYLPYDGAQNANCTFYIAGDRFNPPRTNANGELTLRLPTAAHFESATYSYNVYHPTIQGLVVPLSFAPSSGNLKTVAFPAGASTITGQVQLSDGTPVKNVTVGFKVVGQSNLVAPITTTADASGNYSITVPSGSAGELYAQNSVHHPTFEYALGPFADPGLPVALRAGGVFTPNGNATINLTMPEIAKVTLTAVDAYSEAPVQGAKLKPERTTTVYCHTTGYKAFETATSGVCSFRPLGSNQESPRTDAQGKVDLYLPKTSLMNGTYQYVLTVTHPMTNSRVTETRISVSDTTAISVQAVIPGTPSVPEQPTVTAGDSKVTLNWTEPWNGGAFIDYYQTWYSLNAQGPFQRITTGTCAGNIPADRRSCEVTELVPGVTYYFAIIAHNVVGASGLSVAIASVPTGAVVTRPGGAAPVDSRFATLNPVSNNPLNLGRRSAIIDSNGQVTAPVRSQDDAGKRLDLIAGESKVGLRAGDNMQVREDGVVAIAPESKLVVTASGFEPNSDVSVLLVPDNFYGISASSIFTIANQVLVLGTAKVGSDGEVSVTTELDVPEGGYQLQIIGTDASGALLTFALDAQVESIEPVLSEAEPDMTMAVWTKRIGNQAKIYAKNIIGAGKIQFKVNGKEIAWVRATDETDSKLREANGFYYLVRTVDLRPGKNALEIYVDGERERRTAYSNR